MNSETNFRFENEHKTPFDNLPYTNSIEKGNQKNVFLETLNIIRCFGMFTNVNVV